MKKFKHRSKVGVTLAAILMTIGSVSPAYANNIVGNTVTENPVVVNPASATNNYSDDSNGNKGFGSNLTLLNNSSTNTFGVAADTPSNYNNLTNSSNNTIRSVAGVMDTDGNKNVLDNSNGNTIDGRSNILTRSDINLRIEGNANKLTDSKSNTIIGNTNTLTRTDSNTITGNLNILTGNTTANSESNTITGNSNKLLSETSNSSKNTITGGFNTLIDSTSNTITGSSNQLTRTDSSTITGSNIVLTDRKFVTAVGNDAKVEANSATALGYNSQVTATAPNSVALGANSVANQADTVSVGSVGNERRITNVANGIDNNDAVNVGQWMAGNANTDGKIYRTGALAAALTGIMPLAYDPNNRTQIGVGVGGYHGENAVAFGVNHYINESVLVNAGMSADGSERMYRGGLTWRLGHATKKVETATNTAEVDNLKSQLQQQQSDMQLLKQQVAALTSVAGQKTVVGQSTVEKIVIQDVLFDFDKDTLQQQAYPILDNVVTVVKNNPSRTILLIGNTDSEGLKAYNMDLSLRRAQTVQNYLISQGVPANLLSIEKEGELQPKETNATAEGRAQNRRVEIHIN